MAARLSWDCGREFFSSGLPAGVVGAQIASLDEVTNLELAEFARPLVDGDLEALVRQPGVADNFTIPSQEWATAFFPERFFLEPEVSPGHGDYWDELVGRTPLVRASSLGDWLAELRKHAANPRGRGVPPMFALKHSMIGLVMDGVLPPAEAEALANASFSLKHVDPVRRSIFQDARSVKWLRAASSTVRRSCY